MSRGQGAQDTSETKVDGSSSWEGERGGAGSVSSKNPCRVEGGARSHHHTTLLLTPKPSRHVDTLWQRVLSPGTALYVLPRTQGAQSRSEECEPVAGTQRWPAEHTDKGAHCVCPEAC